MKDIPSNVDAESGEIMEKPYLTSQHVTFDKEVVKQWNYIHRIVRNEKDPDAFAKLDGDTLSLLLTELTAYYESAGKWLVDEKLHLNDLKLARQFKFNDLYLSYVHRKSETNGTAKIQAQMLCHTDDQEINDATHIYEKVFAWKKAVGRWIDTSRSQLSYEKSMTQFGG